MDEISKALPDLVWLTSLDVAGSQISMRGRTLSPNAVSTYLENLKKSPYFKEPVFKNLGLEGGGQGIYAWEMTLVFTNPQALASAAAGSAALPAKRRGLRPRRSNSSSKSASGTWPWPSGRRLRWCSRRNRAVPLWFSNISNDIRGSARSSTGSTRRFKRGAPPSCKLAVSGRGQTPGARAGQAPPDPPSQRNTEELIKRVEALARQGRLRPEEFTPGSSSARISTRVADRHPGGRDVPHLALFFDRMSRFSRIINVEELKIQGLEGQPGKSIAASFVAKTFIYSADEDTPKAGAKAGAPPPAAGAARKMKDRAEGEGVE